MKGFLIIVDGPSATGKDTLIHLLEIQLKKDHRSVFTYEEVDAPGYDKQKILGAKQTGSDEKVAQAFVKERKKLYEKFILPKKENGVIIIGNRGEPSTLVYQSLKNQVSMENIWHLHRNNRIFLPELIVLTSCSVEEALRRDAKRNRIDGPTSLHGKFTRDTDKSNKENLQKRQQIHQRYKQVEKFLLEKGLNVLSISTENTTPDGAVGMILKHVKLLCDK